MNGIAIGAYLERHFADNASLHSYPIPYDGTDNAETGRLLQFAQELAQAHGFDSLDRLARSTSRNTASVGSDQAMSELYARMYGAVDGALPTGFEAPDPGHFGHFARRRLVGAERDIEGGEKWNHRLTQADLHLLDFVWLTFGTFDGVCISVLPLLGMRNMSTLNEFVKTNTAHFRALPRTSSNLRSFLDKYKLDSFYRQIADDPDLSKLWLAFEDADPSTSASDEWVDSDYDDE